MNAQDSELSNAVETGAGAGPEGPVELPALDSEESFSDYVEELILAEPIREGERVRGTVVEVGEDTVSVRIGDGSVGQIDADELRNADGALEAGVGAEIEVYVEERGPGSVRLSKEKADQLRAWDRLSGAVGSDEAIEGMVVGSVKGGLTVDIGARAFLPASQVELRPVRNLDRYIGRKLSFLVTRFDHKRGNIVVSRRTLLEKEKEGLKSATRGSLRPGAIVKGVVRSLVDYGCFVDVGGLDGLLHITDMSWSRLPHPRELVKAGDEITVQVLSFDAATDRIKLGLKQLIPDPWLSADQRYSKGQHVVGRVVNLAEFGAFVELEGGLEGLIHVSEMSWTRRVKHPSEVLTKGESVETVVLGVDSAERRISLGLRQARPNPWETLRDTFPVGSRIRAKVRSVTSFGVFLGVEEGIDGLVHVSDLSWGGQIKDPQEAFQPGDEVEAVVLNVDVAAQRLSLGIKQLERDPWSDIEQRYAIGQVVEGTVVRLLDFGAVVLLEENVEGLIHISEMSDDRVETVDSVVKMDERVRVKVVSLQPGQRKMGLSIKRLLQAEQSADLSAMAQAAPPKRLSIGDLIREKIDVSALPPGKR